MKIIYHLNRFILLVVTALIVTSFNASSQEIPLVEKTIKALRKKDNSGDVPLKLKKHYNWYKRDMAHCESQAYFPEFTQELTDMAAEYDILYPVNVKTALEGARIKYQTLFERDTKKKPNEFATLTNHCSMKLPPGRYYFWAERNGKITSDSVKQDIDDTKSIELTEKK